MNEFRLALSYLTLFPAAPNSAATESPQDYSKATAFFPLVGLAMGIVLWILHAFFNTLFPNLLNAALVVGVWVAMTGGIHLAKIGAYVEGLFASLPGQERLEEKKDQRLIGFGAVGLSLVLLLKAFCVASYKESAFALLYAPTVARFLVLWVGRKAAPGNSPWFRGISDDVLKYACIAPVVLTLFGGWRGLFALALAVCLTMGLLMKKDKLPGLLGLHIELTELLVLLAFCAGL